ncbi:methyl-accepting chemotaxis protein [Rummeliibacillus stabekisii]|uniref:Chemotaxis protein n=1 Tax=Rummeliibacillus stabekisii TaxID=241244 RepID=A0A143HB36_9BACL|nr:methyl-accepting chemotaxis protein [Rummeliibacillus stabekisii]AMW98922.1 hypothetical protein ATY39_05300 [Rummeliibacillus stabekisii]
MKKSKLALSWLKKSISTKLSLSLLVAIIIVFSVTGVMNYTYTKSLLIHDIEEELSTKSNATAESVNSMFSEKQAIVRQIAANQEITDYLHTTQSRNEARTDSHYKTVMQSLDRIPKADESIAMVWVASIDGNFLIGNNNLLQDKSFDIKTRPWYQPALADDDVYFTEPYMDQVFGKVILSAIKQIKDGNKTLGFVAIDLFLDDLPGIMQSYKLGKGGYSFLLDNNGTILYHPDKKLILEKKLSDLTGDMGKIGQKMVTGKEGLQLASVKGQNQYVGYSQVPATGWSVGTSIPQKIALASLDEYVKKMILFFAIGGLLLILIVYLLSKKMLQSIPYMSKVIKVLATGDLTPRLKVQSSDELGQMATDINLMIDSFADTINQVNDSVGQLAASSEELTAISDETVKFSNEVASSTQQIVKGSEQQIEGADQTSYSMEEMANGVQRVAESTTNVSEQTNMSANEATEGYNNIQHAMDQMEQIRNSVGDASSEIQKLEVYSKNIDEMVSGITNIASQTQLLSLNASIEAARAGEHGKGFAVVAAEVKKLSAESQEFSSHIAAIIQKVQSSTATAAKLMNKGVGDVDEGSAILNTAGSSFKQMTNAFQTIADQVSEVSAAAEEISAGTEEVTAAMNDISSVTRNTFEHTKGIASAAEQQSVFMEEISSSAKTLSEMAEDLQTALAKFKTNQ